MQVKRGMEPDEYIFIKWYALCCFDEGNLAEDMVSSFGSCKTRAYRSLKASHSVCDRKIPEVASLGASIGVGARVFYDKYVRWMRVT